MKGTSFIFLLSLVLSGCSTVNWSKIAEHPIKINKDKVYICEKKHLTKNAEKQITELASYLKANPNFIVEAFTIYDQRAVACNKSMLLDIYDKLIVSGVNERSIVIKWDEEDKSKTKEFVYFVLLSNGDI